MNEMHSGFFSAQGMPPFFQISFLPQSAFIDQILTFQSHPTQTIL